MNTDNESAIETHEIPKSTVAPSETTKPSVAPATAAGEANLGGNGPTRSGPKWKRTATKIAIEKIRENLSLFTNGKTSVAVETVVAASPVPIPGDVARHASLFFKTLYQDQLLNILHEYRETPDADGIVHFGPIGAGTTRKASYWKLYCERHPTPTGAAGAWVRINPVAEEGTGKIGTYRDADVREFIFFLLECDDLTVEEQLALFTHVALPISSIATSGGRSVHALVRADCADIETYRDFAKQISQSLRVFGVDPSNSNPSRMTRLPGARRIIDGRGDGFQRLLYLDAHPDGKPIITKGGR